MRPGTEDKALQEPIAARVDHDKCYDDSECLQQGFATSVIGTTWRIIRTLHLRDVCVCGGRNECMV